MRGEWRFAPELRTKDGGGGFVFVDFGVEFLFYRRDWGRKERGGRGGKRAERGCIGAGVVVGHAEESLLCIVDGHWD